MTLEIAKTVWTFVCSHWHHILGVIAFFLASYERARATLAKRADRRAAAAVAAVITPPAPATALPAPSVSNPVAAKKSRSKTTKHKKIKH